MRHLFPTAMVVIILVMLLILALPSRPPTAKADEPTVAREVVSEFDPIALVDQMAQFGSRLAALESRVSDVESRCNCGPDPVPMPTRHEPTAATQPPYPAPQDGRRWVWEVGSHGRHCWITYDVAPANLGSNSPYMGTSPKYQPTPAQRFQSFPAGSSACPDGNCPLRR